MLLKAVKASDASPITKAASRLLALTAVRPGVLRGALWDEVEGIDWTSDAPSSKDAVWRVPAERMKLSLERKDDAVFEHVVPLAEASVDLLRALRPLTRRNPLIFSGERHRPLRENAIGYLYNRCGYHGRHVPHGWRATFSTVMKQQALADGLRDYGFRDAPSKARMSRILRG